ncbi:MAG: orotidine 5'-phosphate decarboxylase / HUMPS family protein [Nitrososphaeraceae archaeon]
MNSTTPDPSSSKKCSLISSYYQKKIKKICDEKESPIILALDFQSDLHFSTNSIVKLLNLIKENICAIKINFHLMLSLSINDLTQINKIAHSFNLLSIADIKLNDIGNTNKITITNLKQLGFDAVIINPFIGLTETQTLVSYSHSIDFGVISLVYMSHTTSHQGYGLNILIDKNVPTRLLHNKIDSIPMYKLLYDYGKLSHIDGVVIGATKLDIIKEFDFKDDKIPIYSPGLVNQGGDIVKTFLAGTDYAIVGRHIINSPDPKQTVIDMLTLLKNN